MDRQEISTKIRTFLEQSFPNPGSELTSSTDLLNGWFIDSLGITQTVLFLEGALGCAVRPDDVVADNFQTLESLTEYVVRQQQE